MSKNNGMAYTVLHLRFRLRVSPDVLNAHSREAAEKIASVEGLLWKIWLVQREQQEIGGIYLFANREAAAAYLNHPVVQSICSNPVVLATDSQIWDVESPLSAITRAPLPELGGQSSHFSEPEALLAGGQ